MTIHETTNSWLRSALVVIALAILVLAILLIPRLTSGQEGEQPDLRTLPPGHVEDSYKVSGDIVPDINGSPYVVSIASFVGSGEQRGSYQTSYWGNFNSKTDNVQTCYVAPVYLPDGVSVTALDSYFVDNTDYQLEIYLFRKPYTAGAPVGYSEMARIWSDPAGVTPDPNVVHWVDSTIVNPSIDNNTYHYYITACPCHPQHQIQSVRVFYDS